MGGLGQILQYFVKYKAVVGIAGLIVLASLLIILQILGKPIFAPVTQQQTYDLLSLIVRSVFYLAIAAVVVSGVAYIVPARLLVPVPKVEYAVAIFRMFDPIVESGVSAIMDKLETFPGFPYYSRESDHPSYWPPRVHRDRHELGALYEAFFQKQGAQKSFADAKARRNDETSITLLGGGPSRDQLPATIAEARSFFNNALGGDPATLAAEIGEPLAAEFVGIEQARAALRHYFPNRIAIIRVQNTASRNLQNLTFEYEVAGGVYDCKVRAEEKRAEQIEWQPFEHRVVIARLLPGQTVDIVIWYQYQSLDERSFPDKINLIQELTQGLTISNATVAQGRVVYNRKLLEKVTGYEKLYEGDARRRDNYDKEIGELMRRRSASMLKAMEESDKLHGSAKGLTLDELASLDVEDAKITAVWVDFRSPAGKSYCAVHVFEHPKGPYVLLTSKDRDRADFAHTQADIATTFGGDGSDAISDRGDDICASINVEGGFTRALIAEKFAALPALGYQDVGVQVVHYAKAPD